VGSHSSHQAAMLLGLLCVALVGLAGLEAQTLVETMPVVTCKRLTAEETATLQKRKESLETEIAKQTKIMEAADKSAPAADALKRSQVSLLDVLFQLDCVPTQETAAPTPRMGTSRSISSASNVIQVTTYYATNRKLTGNADPVKFYGPGTDLGLKYGRAVVTIPLAHTPGYLERPKLWRLEREADPNKHFTLKSVVPLETDEARKELAEKLQEATSRTLLLFVHGYNMTFADAAMRTAQITHDLKFSGLAFFYSWPSAGQILGYWQDEEAARLSEMVFERLLEDLSQLPIDGIYLVAHSMGSRIVGHALQSRVDKGKDTKNLRELLLAAPDINAEIFRDVIAPKLSTMQGMRTTIYASSSDMALKASRVVHGFRRVGDTQGGVLTFPRLETVDASGISSAARGYGHFYLVDSSTVIRDMQTLILRSISAKLRGLKEVNASPASYWQLFDASDGTAKQAPR
jgi:esterase/lipase superfamily enzyme